MTEPTDSLITATGQSTEARCRGLLILVCIAMARATWGGGLWVSPESGLEASGFLTGPFVPVSHDYVLSNATEMPLFWSAEPSASWLSLSEYSGTIDPAETRTVSVFLNSSAIGLPLGSWTASVKFTNVTEGESATFRDVLLEITLPGEASVEFVPVASNSMVFRITGQAGATYVIETSTDLLEWAPFGTNTLAESATRFEVVIPEDSQRFYRAQCADSNAVPASLFFGNDVSYLESHRQVRVIGVTNGIYQLEISVDQVSWGPVATNKLCATDSYVYTNPDGVPSEAVFRARPAEPALEPVHHVLIVGQSLAIGAEGAPALTVEASDRHLRFYADETGSYVNVLYELGVETIASSAGYQATTTDPAYRMAFSNTGVGGAVYSELKKGTANFAFGVTQFSNAPAAFACRLLGHRPAALFAVHGEGDRHNPNYDLDIRQWQADYEADVGNVTGFRRTIPMFHSQMSSWTTGAGGTRTAVGPNLVLAESEANPDKTILVCPKYFLPHALPLGIHLTNQSYRWLGQYYGKAYRRVVIEGGTWTPLKPASITREGVVITARFDVPAPPLALDTNLVSDPGNYGFEYWDDSGSLPDIVGVELTGPDTVQITLSAEPTGAGQRLRYAYTGIQFQPGGPTTGPRGNLRDSDSETSTWEDPLYNWCVHFDKPIQ